MELSEAKKGQLLEIGGTNDHVHILAGFHPTVAVSYMLQHMKGNSSKWVNDRKMSRNRFEWQTGYGAFTVSQSQVQSVRHYIQQQAIALSITQTAVFLIRERLVVAFPVQIRVTYTALLLVCYLPYMRWLYWLPTAGTFALILFGYCLTARFLSILRWNRTERLSLNLLRRTFLSPPVVDNVQQGLPSDGCPGGVCSLEARVAEFKRR